MGLSEEHAATVLLNLSEIEEQRANQLAQYDTQNLVLSSDDEKDSESVIFDTFFSSGGAEGILKMTNFSPEELKKLFDSCKEYLEARWSLGRGKKHNFVCLMFFMTITVMKFGGSWEFLASLFKLNCSTFQRVIQKFVEIFHVWAFKYLVENREKRFKMEVMHEKNQKFK